MTVRLVALMSVVLLLSLAAFGLVIDHYQDQVKQEVARTVSEVGRATLRSFEIRGEGAVIDPAAPEDGAASPVEPRKLDVRVRAEGAPHRIAALRYSPPAGVALPVEGQDAEVVSVAVVCEADGRKLTPEDCAALHGVEAAGLHDRLFVDIDDVQAESDPAEGMVLRIKTFRPESSTSVAHWVAGDAGPTGDAPGFVFTRQEDIRLPIPVEEYDSLFAAARRRSIWLFLGIFVVGTTLSAGLATRFTRPIRRLDAGIRRLSAGDLEVQVPTRGTDEFARLGRAFNDMARSLRANRQRAQEMIRREKHSALGRLAAGVAHDVRNPLHSIGLTLQHLRETCRPESAERAVEFDRSVDIIRGEIRRLDQTVGDFLRFAKSEVQQRRAVDLRELLGETARLIGKEAEWRRVEVRLEIDESVPEVEANAEAIRSAILNLVLNSFEAMPDGGRLTLSLGRSHEGAVLEVADTGDGIPEQDRERVFDFAFTTKEGGSGLGLAMVYQSIVEDHAGRIELDDAPGGGTRVRMVLPHGEASRGEDVA